MCRRVLARRDVRREKFSSAQVSFFLFVCSCRRVLRPRGPHRVSSIIDFNLCFHAAAVHQVDLVLSRAHARRAPAYSCVSRRRPERV